MEKNGINILLIEDNPGDAKLVSELLKECVGISLRMTHAVRIDEALKILTGEKFDVVLLDLNLPDSQGLDGIEKITAQEPAVPVIIFTSLDDETLGIQAVRKNAEDYLVKGQINSNILLRSIRYAIERKQVEEALRKSREDLNHAQAVGNIGSWRLDVRRNELTWSDENHRIFGISKGAPMTYETFLSTVHPDDRDYVEARWKESLAGEPYDIEHRIIVDGQVKWVREKASLEFDSKRALVGGFGVTQDITERKHLDMLSQALNNINFIINSTRDFDEIMSQVVVQACKAIVAESAAISLRKGNEWVVSYTYGSLKLVGERMADEEALHADLAINTKQVVVINDAFNDNRVNREHMRKYNIRSVIVIPLVTKEGAIGVLFLNHQTAPVTFTKAQIDFAEKLGTALSLVVENTKLFEAEKKSKEKFEILSETASRLLATDRPQEVLKDICRKVMTFLGCHVCFNYLVDEEKQRLHLNAYSGIPEETDKEIEWLDYGVSVCGCAARDARRVVAEDIPNTPDPRTDHVKSFGIKAYASHPLFSAGRVIGTLSFGTRTRSNFTEEDLSLMKTVSDQVATAMERIRLIEALRKSHDELESRVQERTAELKKVVEALQDEMEERKQAEQSLKAASSYTRNLIEISLDPLVTISQDGKIMDVNRATELITGAFRDELIGSVFADYFTEPEKANEGYREVFSSGSIRDYPLAIRHRSGFITEVLYNATLYRNKAGEAGVIAAARDVTERNAIERRTIATNALLSLFSRKTSRKDYLDAVVDLLHSWSDCRCVGIRILNDQGYIPYESYIGFSREFWESENRLSIEHDQCVCIRVVTGNPGPQDDSVMTPGGSFHCDDTVAFVGRLSAEEKTRFRGVCIQNGFLSLNVIPIRYGKKVLGTMHLADKERKKLSLPFIEFLESMSPLIGEALNRFMLEDEIRGSETRLRFLSSQLISAQEDERKRISAELHDDIAAKLAAIKFSLEKKLTQKDQAINKVNQSLNDIVSIVTDTIASTRRIMINLRPAMIDDLGILATLNWYCREFEQIFSTIHVEKQVNIEENEISDHLKIVIFRIVQEGMNNISKHSGANHVALTLKKINDFLTLSIEDNGRGFDVENKTFEPEKFQGLGMVNMEERARLSGGGFSINSLRGKGTSIKVTWPLKPIARDNHLRIELS